MNQESKIWLKNKTNTNMALELEKLFKSNFLIIPGAHDAISALLAKKAGFKALYLSGGALSSSLGMPDIGIITMEELVNRTKQIVSVTNLPIIVDGDTGYGEVVNVIRLVREIESVGAAAIQIEDQILPKKCGHLNGKQIISKQEMMVKIQAASEASNNLKIIARTDSVQNEGIESAIERAKDYVNSGADIIFPEALTSKEDFKKFSKNVDAPILANMTEFGITPDIKIKDLESSGVKMAIWPVSSLRVTLKSVEKFYNKLKKEKTSQSSLNDMYTRSELYELLNYNAYEELDQKIIKTILPD
tara:strand:- start:1096 stop:2004 length:909 start_codon:yes stop_codon:yes gene_type:complete